MPLNQPQAVEKLARWFNLSGDYNAKSCVLAAKEEYFRALVRLAAAYRNGAPQAPPDDVRHSATNDLHALIDGLEALDAAKE